MANKLEWGKLLSSTRRKSLGANKGKTSGGPAKRFALSRTQSERDYDRVLFCTPVRRLADKTQVFPLEKNDSVRTRLTHSHEVSNLARSIGVSLVSETNFFDNIAKSERNIPAVLAAIGLAHDIGNPPFGHEGEAAIGQWFKQNSKVICHAEINKQMKQDYINFEGNAQALRILTKLQILNDNFGLNLTCGTLTALMKYPSPSQKVVDDDSDIARKKFGYFYSETEVCKQIWAQTGLKEGIRHPLAFIMEASDDIAYSVLDAEDAITKGLVSYRDLIDHLKPYNKDEVIKTVIRKAEAEHKKYISANLHPNELNDISMQMFRVFAIGEMISAATRAFEDNYNEIIAGSFKKELIKVSDGEMLCKQLKKFSFKHAYKHRSVLELELQGYKVIHDIMDMLWQAIETRGCPKLLKNHEGNIFDQYAYGLISENYRRIFEDKTNSLPLQYKRVQLLADMVSGMTDSFAIDFCNNLTRFKLSAKN